MKLPSLNPDWQENVKALYRHDMQEIWDPNIARHIWNQYHSQLDTYLSLITDGERLKILDVGCAQGTLALLFAEKGHEVWAVDIKKEFLDYAASRHEKGNIHFIQGNAIKVDLSQTFDLIFANQIVEHLVRPAELVSRLKYLLRPGGRLIMTTPNAHYVKSSLPFFSEIGDLSQYENRQFSADADGHFFAYSADELIRIFNDAGFNNIEARYFETPWISGHMKIRFLHSVVPYGILKCIDRVTLSIPVVRNRLAHQLMIIGS